MRRKEIQKMITPKKANTMAFTTNPMLIRSAIDCSHAVAAVYERSGGHRPPRHIAIHANGIPSRSAAFGLNTQVVASCRNGRKHRLIGAAALGPGAIGVSTEIIINLPAEIVGSAVVIVNERHAQVEPIVADV